MSLSLSDVQTLAGVAMGVDSNPTSLVGRFAGLSPEEQQLKMPLWGWVGLALGGGVAAYFLLRQTFGAESPSRPKRAARDWDPDEGSETNEEERDLFRNGKQLKLVSNPSKRRTRRSVKKRAKLQKPKKSATPKKATTPKKAPKHRDTKRPCKAKLLIGKRRSV
jgi:hypothetical protein